MTEISVIIPVYNVEKYLKRCVDSILIQTYTDYELILVDDGSTDASGSICDYYADIDKRVRVIHQSNQGQAAARNKGLDISIGAWIHFVDSDDAIHPQMLETLFHMVSETGLNMAMCGHAQGNCIPDTFYKKPSNDYEILEISEKMLEKMLVTEWEKYGLRYGVVWAKLVKKGIAQKTRFTEGRIYEDTVVSCQWLYEAKKVANSWENMYFYYVNSNGTTKSVFSSKQLDHLWSWSEQERFYRRIGYRRLELASAEGYIIEGYNCYLKMKENNIRCTAKLKTKGMTMIKLIKNWYSVDKSLRARVIKMFFPRCYTIIMSLKKI